MRSAPDLATRMKLQEMQRELAKRPIAGSQNHPEDRSPIGHLLNQQARKRGYSAMPDYHYRAPGTAKRRSSHGYK
jgi:hypothetical protein